MWETKRFKTYAQQAEWIASNKWRYSITVLFVNNGFAVEYKKLRRI
jgi:hypothetical protein